MKGGNWREFFKNGGFDIYKIKHPSKSGFIALINELAKHIVEHYFTLMTLEKEIWRKKLSIRNSGK